MDKTILKLIVLYKRLISPLKGYRCAYGALYGGESCSTEVYRIIQTKGVIRGLPLVYHQFANCSAAYEILASRKRKNNHKRKDKSNKKKDKENLACELPCQGIGCLSSLSIFHKVFSNLHKLE